MIDGLLVHTGRSQHRAAAAKAPGSPCAASAEAAWVTGERPRGGARALQGDGAAGKLGPAPQVGAAGGVRG